jgi:hypothetical protein
MTNEEIIQEILHEAHSYGLLHEVIDTAKSILDEEPNLDRVLAYEMALKEWVK